MKGPASLVMNSVEVEKVVAAAPNYDQVTKQLHSLVNATLIGERIFSPYLANERNTKIQDLIEIDMKAYLVQDLGEKTLTRLSDTGLTTTVQRKIKIKYFELDLVMVATSLPEDPLESIRYDLFFCLYDPSTFRSN